MRSANIRTVEYLGVLCVICSDCSYDERQQYDLYPEEKVSQREKGRFTPYKAGGCGAESYKKLVRLPISHGDGDYEVPPQSV